jgi:uncharacterized membrane protein
MAIGNSHIGQRSTSGDKGGTQSSNVKNVGNLERLLSLAGGGVLAVAGAMRGTLPGLGAALLGLGLIRRGWTGNCAMYGLLGVSTARRRSPMTSIPAGQGIRIDKTFTVNRSPEELYDFWHDLENLPSFMSHLQSVRTDGRRSHWVAYGPLGHKVEWDAEIHHEHPHEVIGWRSLEGSEVDSAGSVHFTPAPDGRGTQVRVVLKYNPPAGRLGAAIAKLFLANPEREITKDLHQFKQMMETWEFTDIEG